MSKEHVLTIGKKVNGESYKCIVVDDSEFMVKNLKRILNSPETKVIDTAFNGREAIESVQEHRSELDFITLDITMPEMDGLEALEKIQDIDSSLTILMASAMGQEDTVKKAVMKGRSFHSKIL